MAVRGKKGRLPEDLEEHGASLLLAWGVSLPREKRIGPGGLRACAGQAGDFPLPPAPGGRGPHTRLELGGRGRSLLCCSRGLVPLCTPRHLLHLQALSGSC